MRNFFLAAVLYFALPGCTLFAQQAAAVLHQFKPLPPGLYEQTGQAYRDGKPIGQPVTDKHCGAETSPQAVDALKKMQAQIAPSCSMQVLQDTPIEAEWEQTCDPGVMQTVIHSTSRRVDDVTVTLDTDMTKGGQQLSHLHTTLKYMGICPAGMATPPVTAMPKPSAEDCAELPEMREQAKAVTIESCHNSDFPPSYVARCEASMKILKDHMQQLESACKP